MLKPKKTITKKEIERDPFLESINKTQAHLQEKRSYYMKMALALIVVLIGYNIISEKTFLYFKDKNIYGKLIKDTNIVISGEIEEFSGYGFNVINATIESGKLSSGVTKSDSSMKNPLNVKDIVNLYENNAKQARIKYSGKLFIEGYINSISENNFTISPNLHAPSKLSMRA